MKLEAAGQAIGLAAIIERLSNGYLDIVDVEGTVGASLRFADPAFDEPIAGAAEARAITADEEARATITTAAFIAYAADHETPVLSGTAGKGAELDLHSSKIQRRARVSVDRFALTLPATA
jgi:hypothetical protein